jgi:hypothetical protein
MDIILFLPSWSTDQLLDFQMLSTPCFPTLGYPLFSIRQPYPGGFYTGRWLALDGSLGVAVYKLVICPRSEHQFAFTAYSLYIHF